MNAKILTLAGIFVGLACLRVHAQTYDTNNVAVQTFAGSGFYGYYDGQGTQTMFYNPSAIVADSNSNLFVLDSGNSRIRKITSDGLVSTFVGGGLASIPGYGTNVSLLGYTSGSMAIDHSNTIWVTSGNGTALLRVESGGYVSTVDLPGVNNARGICIDSLNNVYISATEINKIYRLRTNGTLEVFVGSGNQGSVDGNGIFNSFYFPTTLAVDSADNIYVWDWFNYLLRKVTQNRDVVTIAGRKGVSADVDGIGADAGFSYIAAMSIDGAGNIYFTSGSSGSSIRRITATTNVTTLAGSFSQTGYTNGIGSMARFSGANGMCLSQGLIFIDERENQRIRTISFNPTAQLVSPANLNLRTYPGLEITGIVGRTYRIESSGDMTNWFPETTLLLTISPYVWIDQKALGQKKFYRAYLLP